MSTNVGLLGHLDCLQPSGEGLCGTFNPDEKTFVGSFLGDECSYISAWNLHNKKNLLMLPEYWSNDYSVPYSRYHVGRYAGHYPRTTHLASSTDGHVFVSGGVQGDIVIWDAHTMQASRTITGHKSAIRSLIVSSDGSMLVSGSDDTTIKIWNLQSGKLLYTLEGHTQAITSLMISADGQTLLSAGKDNTLRLWDVHRGATLRMIALPQEKQPGVISTAAVTSDGKLLVASVDDKTIKIWGNK